MAKKILAPVKDAWLIVGITLAMLALLEGMFWTAFRIRDGVRGRPASAFDECIILQNGLSGLPWKDRYIREWEAAHRTRWLSYVYWRRRPHHGTCINIDAEGLRKTWTRDRGYAESTDCLTIFVFGGSTIWGTGARDDFTIPSCLAKRLADSGLTCKVTNFGEAGYVTTQEVITLIRQLQRGNIPDLVVFYDGVNDTYSAYQQQTAGLPENEFNRVREFNLSQAGCYPALGRLFLRRTACELSTVRLLNGLAHRLGLVARSDSVIHQAYTGNSTARRETLAREILTIYRSNLDIVETLAKRYGFKALFYWQPILFEKVHRTASEEAEGKRTAALQPFFQATYDSMRQVDLPAAPGVAFHDLTGLFSDVQQPIFLDWCHLTEQGNGMVAGRIAQDILAAAGDAGSFIGQITKGP